ncbi:MAG: MFS transporter [Gordonia sp. (in: high G+C Gram-positive bacteria)]
MTSLNSGDISEHAEVLDTQPSLDSGFRRYLVLLLPTSVVMYAVYNGIQSVLLPQQVQEINPADKVSNLALLTAVSSITAVIGLLLGGVLSDRTRGRFGRRTPWLLGTAVVSSLFLAVMGTLTSILLLAVVYGALWFSMNMYQSALTAGLPDRVPESRMGLASSVMGLGTPLGIMLGVNALARTSRVLGYTAVGVVLVVITILFITIAREKPFTEGLPSKSQEKAADRSLKVRISYLFSFLHGFRSRDFTFAFIQRAMVFFAVFTVSGLLYYVVQDYVGVDNLPNHNAALAVSTLVTVQTVAWVIAVPIFGWLADKFNRRKLFVLLCCVGFTLSLLIPIVWPTWIGMLVYNALLGISFGSYMAIDLALMALVLPDQQNAGRDLAVLAVATAGPQAVAPLVGAALFDATGTYVSIFIFGIVVSAIAAVLVLFIRSVR